MLAVLFFLVVLAGIGAVVWAELTGRVALRRLARRYWNGESLWDDEPAWDDEPVAPRAPARVEPPEPPRSAPAPLSVAPQAEPVRPPEPRIEPAPPAKTVAPSAPPAPRAPPLPEVRLPEPAPAAPVPPPVVETPPPVRVRVSRAAPVEPAPRDLPPVDIDYERLRKRYQAEHDTSPTQQLPTIELHELRDNLSGALRQRRGDRRAAPAAAQQGADLPVIDPNEVKASLREIHGHRLKGASPASSVSRILATGAAPTVMPSPVAQVQPASSADSARAVASSRAAGAQPSPTVMAPRPVSAPPQREAPMVTRAATPPVAPASPATPVESPASFVARMREARVEHAASSLPEAAPASPGVADAVSAPPDVIDTPPLAAPAERPSAAAQDADGSANLQPVAPFAPSEPAPTPMATVPSVDSAPTPEPEPAIARAIVEPETEVLEPAPVVIPAKVEAHVAPAALAAVAATLAPAVTLTESAAASAAAHAPSSPAPALPWTLIEEKPAAAPAPETPAARPLMWTLIDGDTAADNQDDEPAAAAPLESAPPADASQAPVAPWVGPEPAAVAPWQSTPPAPAPIEEPAPVHHHAALPVVYGDACMPPLDLLLPAAAATEACSQDMLIERGIVIEEKCAEFKVKVSVVDAYAGPVITRYEVEPAVGVRGNQVVNLMKDLSRALGLASIRVVETIPGKTCMGLELPNPVRQMIRLSEILSAEVFQGSNSLLTMALGKDITGEPVVMDLAKAPHLLVAGTTGSGKSVGVNAMILSLLYKASPDQVRFIMIDPKMLELSVYNDIPHLLAPVVTDMKLAANALNWCVGEMERRYRLMSALGVRNLAGYNEKVLKAEEDGRRLTNPFTLTPDNPEPLAPLPFIVVVVDEFADLMMVAGKKIEELIARLAQKARAAGIHLILATQRPSVDVITGLIKANIPTRIAFQVSSKVDSRTILDQMGAESLLGQGDMLFLPPGTGYPQRVHGAFVTDAEVHAVVEHLKQFGEPDYVEGLLTGEAEADEESAAAAQSGRGASEADPLYDEAVEIVLRTRKASISSVQRHLRIGYNRAARLIEQMEEAGLVSAMESNGNRTVLVPERNY